jgi:hypothetical protein
MKDAGGEHQTPEPLLLKFSRRAIRKNPPFHYDPQRRLNVLESGSIPAVLGGIDLKTVPPGPGED